MKKIHEGKKSSEKGSEEKGTEGWQYFDQSMKGMGGGDEQER